MQLFTDDIRRQLLANGVVQAPVRGTADEIDFKLVVKLFTPFGGATWLLTEVEPDEPDIAFGPCDLGMGFPELGTVRLSELEGAGDGFGTVERDLFFAPRLPAGLIRRAMPAGGADRWRSVECLAPIAAAPRPSGKARGVGRMRPTGRIPSHQSREIRHGLHALLDADARLRSRGV